MTRKDYIAFAELLHSLHEQTADGKMNGHYWTVDRLAEQIARVFASDNPKFDRTHFLAVVRGEKDLHSHPLRKRRPVWKGDDDEA